MHVPDGFLSMAVSLVCWGLALLGVGLALWRSGSRLRERQVPLMGVLAAFIFAAQMINFTVVGGTSGHLIGGALAAILLGPWAGMIALTTVVAIQAVGPTLEAAALLELRVRLPGADAEADEAEQEQGEWPDCRTWSHLSSISLRLCVRG